MPSNLAAEEGRVFSYTGADKMSLYLNYFCDNLMLTDDQPPIGIILCTYDDEAEVKYVSLDRNGSSRFEHLNKTDRW